MLKSRQSFSIALTLATCLCGVGIRVRAQETALDQLIRQEVQKMAGEGTAAAPLGNLTIEGIFPKPDLLERASLEISTKKFFGSEREIRTEKDFEGSRCAGKTYQEINKNLYGEESPLNWLFKRIQKADRSPVPLVLADRKKGWFGRKTLGQFDPETGAIHLYCHENTEGPHHSLREALKAMTEEHPSYTLTHEMAHLFMYRSYGRRFPTKNVHYDPGKTYERTNPAIAWMEGFANFSTLLNSRPQACSFGQSIRDECPYTIAVKMKGNSGGISTGVNMQGSGGKWLKLPWKEKIKNRDFVFAFLYLLAKEPDERWEENGQAYVRTGGASLEEMEKLFEPLLRARQDMPRGMHESLDDFLKHYLKLFPEEKDKVKKAILEISRAESGYELCQYRHINRDSFPDWMNFKPVGECSIGVRHAWE